MAQLIPNLVLSAEPLEGGKHIMSIIAMPWQLVHPGLIVAYDGLHMITQLRSVQARPEGTKIEFYTVETNP